MGCDGLFGQSIALFASAKGRTRRAKRVRRLLTSRFRTSKIARRRKFSRRPIPGRCRQTPRTFIACADSVALVHARNKPTLTSTVNTPYRLRMSQRERYRFLRQNLIGAPCIMDFVMLQADLVIELDGGQHDALHRRGPWPADTPTSWKPAPSYRVLPLEPRSRSTTWKPVSTHESVHTLWATDILPSRRAVYTKNPASRCTSSNIIAFA